MSPVSAIGSAASSISTSIAAMAAVSHNLANMRTTRPPREPAFQGERVVQEETPGGVVISDVVPAGTAEGVLLSEPESPMADERGLVRYPDIDVGAEMVQLMTAQRSIEANVATIHHAVDTYRDLLAMTNSDRSRLAASGG